MPFPLLVELKLYFESMLEELHWPHMECITFPSDQSQWLLEGAAPIFFLNPKIGCLTVKKSLNEDEFSSDKTNLYNSRTWL